MSMLLFTEDKKNFITNCIFSNRCQNENTKRVCAVPHCNKYHLISYNENFDYYRKITLIDCKYSDNCHRCKNDCTQVHNSQWIEWFEIYKNYDQETMCNQIISDINSYIDNMLNYSYNKRINNQKSNKKIDELLEFKRNKQETDKKRKELLELKEKEILSKNEEHLNCLRYKLKKLQYEAEIKKLEDLIKETTTPPVLSLLPLPPLLPLPLLPPLPPPPYEYYESRPRNCRSRSRERN